jgi:NAD(P)-dependent dehydrogenase (short-subunit alcohol dehydrogenase family)
MGVNHLAHFLLTNLLKDLLKAAAPSRIVIVSSEMHYYGKNIQEDLMLEKSYDKYKGYANSKLANVLHGRYLAKLLEGTGVTVNSLHPGFVQTEVGRHTKIFHFFTSKLLFFMYKNVNEGAQTQIKLAVDPDLEKVTGKFFSDCKEKKASKEALNDEIAEWLWNKSKELVEK